MASRFPQPWDKRVFIGANYLDQRVVVDVIEEIVANLVFTLVVMAKTYALTAFLTT